MRKGIVLAVAVVALAAPIAAVASSPSPGRHALAPRADPQACGAFLLRADGTLRWLSFEGGVWEFAVGPDFYDLGLREGDLSPQWAAWLMDHVGTGVPATVEGVVYPCQPTAHMHGAPVVVLGMHVDGDPPAPDG